MVSRSALPLSALGDDRTKLRADCTNPLSCDF
jgi:hypothetical protein